MNILCIDIHQLAQAFFFIFLVIVILIKRQIQNYKKLYVECYSLWIRNMDTRKKWREGHKRIWNVVPKKNVKNKMDR